MSYLWPQQTPEQVFSSVLEEYKPIRTFAMFSGGNDSIVTTHFAMSHGAQEVVHINTGIGIQETREFVRETCKSFGWPLKELYPPDSSYDDFVMKHGFPGPYAHRYSYVWLKERALRKLIRETKTKRNDKVMLITGVRNLESARRMGYVTSVQKQGNTIWVAPMFQYSKIDLHAYKAKYSLPKNPVVEKFHMSGECLCGAYAHEGEMKELEEHFPDVANKLHVLEEKVKSTGKPCVWGHRGKWVSSEVPDDNPLFMPMCVGCSDSKRREI